MIRYLMRHGDERHDGEGCRARPRQLKAANWRNRSRRWLISNVTANERRDASAATRNC